MEYNSAIKRNIFESVLMRWMSLEPIIQSEISRKEKNKCCILMLYMESRKIVLINLLEVGNGTPLQYSWPGKSHGRSLQPGRLQSMGSLRVGHYWETSPSLFTFMHWRRKWQPTVVFLPGESQGWGSLAGCHLWGLTESDTTEAT